MLEQVAERLRGKTRLLVITGAGMSADSGVPTYRGVAGLYAGRTTETGLPIEEALSATTFARDPALTWRHIAEIEERCRHAKPHAGHFALAALERGREITILTQNVDGFHREAGSTDVIDIHGDLHRLFCTACRYSVVVEDYSGLDIPPRCPDCGGLVRPDVVLFEEALPLAQVARLERAFEDPWQAVLSIGTSSAFPYVVEPIIRAVHAGVTTVEINPEETDISGIVDLHLRMGARDALVELLARLG